MRMNSNKKWIFALFLTVALVFIPTCSAEAGLSKNIVDAASSVEALDEAVWSNPNGDVEAKNQVLYFSSESTDETRLITRQATQFSKDTEQLFSASFQMKCSQLPEQQSFIFAMGLGSIESVSGESGNIEIHFSRNGNLQTEVVAYNDAGEMVQVSKKTSCGNASADISVEVELSTSRKLLVKVGGKTVCDGEVPTDGNGSVGFLQTGGCGAEIRDLKLIFYQYDRPENTNLEETFEEGIFNANLLHSSLIKKTNYSPCRMQVEDYNGSNVLMFKNVAIGYIGTRHMYSNFELTFDVPYLQTTPIVDERGTVTTPTSGGIGITFGDDSIQYTKQAFGSSSADLLVLSGDGAYSYNTKHSAKVKEHFFGTNGNTKPFSVRVSVIDGNVTLGVKWMEETTYEDFLTYTLDVTPTGYIHIWAPTEKSASFAIDNIKLVNKDNNPNLVDVDFKEATLDIPEDYEFKPQGLVYNPDKAQQTEADYWYLPMVIVFVSCAVMLGLVAICVKGRRKRNGGAVHEK